MRNQGEIENPGNIDLNITRAKRLGSYLKSRRSRLQPEQVGLSKLGTRRTPGLRREELAILAGVSATYYAWLEQGREVSVSREVIENIGRALRLSEDEYLHLLELWNANQPEAKISITREINEQWRVIVDALPYPAFVSNDRAEILAWSPGAAELFRGIRSRSQEPLNVMELMFTEPQMRSYVLNWHEMVQHSVGIFRISYDRYAHDPWFSQFVDQLTKQSTDFAELWKQHRIEAKRVTRLQYLAPGEQTAQTYEIKSLTFASEHPDLHLCILFLTDS